MSVHSLANARSRSRNAGVRLACAMRSTRRRSLDPVWLVSSGILECFYLSQYRLFFFSLRPESLALILVTMSSRLSQLINTRSFRNETRQIVAATYRHTPARIRTVGALPDRPGRAVTAFGAQSFQRGIAFSEGPRH